jgi:ATP-dependent helicase/nuclease subunit B
MPRLILLPPGADLADAFAQDLIGRRRGQLPDLAAATVVVPAPAAGAHLRRRLAHHAGRGLLGPRVVSLAGLAALHVPDTPPLSALECRLLLTEALRKRRALFAGQDHAHVAAALFELFEELTAERFDPGADEATFQDRLVQAYGGAPLPWLSREAQLVHALWLAFREDAGDRAPAALHLRGLQARLAVHDAANPVHLLGLDEFSGGELALVREALVRGSAELWLAGRTEGHDGAATAGLLRRLALEPERRAATPAPLGALLDAAFATQERHPGERRGPVPSVEALDSGNDILLRIVEAGGAEHEARCVDLAVREALLAGARDVVVLTEDRRLARRLRALLERAAVPLQDPTGWALSTSRAAAALDAWLECLEGRFRFRPLLDLLKSGFVEADAEAVDRLERRLVYGDGIDGGLRALIAAAHSKPLEALLQRLQDAAFALPRGGEPVSAQRWTELLARSLERTGLHARLELDAAGAQVLRALGQLRAAFARVPLALRWDEFRALVDGVLEEAVFSPDAARGPVRLLTLAQAQPLACELLIVAGATRDRLPGAPPRLPFFSQAVRAELGLPDWHRRHDLALSRLRRALDGAARVLVTYAAGNDEEPAQPSPWIEAIEAQAARHGTVLRDRRLPALAAGAACEIGDPTAGVARAVPRPAPPAPAPLLPERLSATAHQALLDCPYRFFARSVLKLEPEHAPDEDPNRSDYGQRVHRILEAFAQPVAGMPAPFTERIGAANRDRARARLEEIADAVFAMDLSRRALALTWKAEFRAAIPALLEWMAARPLLRQVRAEVELTQELEGQRIYGRIDRLETRTNGSQVVVDYKTGRLPKEGDIVAGEQVQLLHYALLDPAIAAVEYRPLRKGEKPQVYEDDLPQLRDAVRARLGAALRALRAGARLPAQGDEAVCERCEYSGVCRREDWATPDGGTRGQA